ncbi:peptidyl-prolyl cis-trans isomerase [Cytophagales bacterium WSM2-2]|nr:peptidyl-prolyl cis-trans isomerase [Cytophagales bacterium WSM2-2]
MRKSLLVLGFLITGILAFGQSKRIELFTVNKTPVYTNEFVYLFKKNHPGQRDFTEAKVNEYLELFINFKLKIAEARLRGYDTTAKFNKELKTYSDELKKPYRAEKDLLDKLTRETYDHLTQEVKASHILIQIKAEASADDTLQAYNKISDIKKRISAGEDFEKLARELSEDPSAKYNGGSLGYFTAMQMVYPFEKAAFQTKVGEISPVIRSRFGYHLIKVMDKKASRGEVEVSHILLRATKENLDKTKNKIFEIYDQVKSGRNWDELCKEFSEDNNTKNSGGRLRPFGVGAIPSVPEFEATAFALQKPGDISDPFQSNLGWHIIRLEKKIPVPSYGEVESSLKKRVARDERMKISEDAVAAKRKIELGYNENQPVKAKVLALADSSLLKGNWRLKGNEELKKSSLFTVGAKNFTVGEFVSAVEKQHSKSNLSPSAFMDQLCNNFAEGKIGQAEDEKIIKENPEFQHLMTEYREGILLFEIMEREIWNKASEDSVGQRKFYTENQDKYKAGSRVEARIFSIADKSFVTEIKNKISKGDSITKADMKKFKSIQRSRNYEKGDSKVIDKINWVPGIQETELDGVTYLVEVTRLVEPGIKKFEEARAQVISGYQDSLEKSWVAALKKKYEVKVNSKGKNTVMEELLKK